MQNDKNFSIVGGVVLVLAIVAVIGITYASLSQQLEINGEGTVKATTWEIKFANLGAATTVGSAVEVTAPTINTNDTKIGDYSVKLTKPGDEVSYTFDIVNNGEINAELSSYTLPTPTCTGNGDSAETDSTNICKNLNYSLTYSDGTPVAQNDTLNAGETKNLKLTLGYKTTIANSELPLNDVVISNLGITMIYAQAD